MIIEVNGKKLKMNENSTVSDMLKRLELSPEIFLVVRKNEIVTEDEKIRDGESFRTVSVVSGG